MTYSKLEEYLNSITHYIGAGLSILGLVILINKAMLTGKVGYTVGSIIFGIAMIILYTMSGTYHILNHGKLKNIFKILDHSAIYLLISASYTPYVLTCLEGPSKWIIFSAQWGMAVCGIIFKTFYINKFKKLSTIIYLLMGWMVVFVFKDLKLSMSALSLNFLIAGGVTYSLGVIFYSLKNVKYFHVVWHLFVIGGSVLNYMSVYYLY